QQCWLVCLSYQCFFLQAEDGIRDFHVTGVQTCALPISTRGYFTRREDRPQPFRLFRRGHTQSRRVRSPFWIKEDNLTGLEAFPVHHGDGIARFDCHRTGSTSRYGMSFRARRKHGKTRYQDSAADHRSFEWLDYAHERSPLPRAGPARLLKSHFRLGADFRSSVTMMERSPTLIF